MIQKITPKNTTFIIILFSILFFAKSNMHAQTILPQSFDDLERLCAGGTFNEFYATFSYVDFPAGTTFEVELSDNLGNFTNSTIATKLDVTDVTTTKQIIKFALPVNLVGSELYGIRIKSSTGVTSVRYKNSNTQATDFPAYYKVFEGSFSINGKSGTATICAGGSITLNIDNDTPSVITSSPLNYPNLKYRWFKDGAIIAGQSGKSLVVNSVGEYYAFVEYGACTEPNISSNRITVTSSSSGSAATINSSLGNPFCASADGTVLTATSGNSYAWKKDGKDFGGNTRTVKATESGIYTVSIDFGGCNATGTIDLKSNGFNASIDVADEFKLDEGETLNVTVTTDAANPTYEWYLNNNLISGATTDSYLVASIGTYKVKISQSSGCISSKEFIFQAKGKAGPSSVIPNIISLSGASPYWNIPDEYKNANTKVMIISSNGDMVLDVNNYQGDWPQTSINFKNVNPVYYYVIKGDAGEKKGSITVIR
ncbi:gliding motility protein SprC [Flavobacterium sp. AC]|uniref:Gliding motility protein SprC n=1 Tax=Flavobacterium azizsancarii TaxID=2961580 RepID=A0ABT4WEC7_9FLAO|nr:gliding motility protein SprC [Flavobacterium azizsancarii]MDA6070906.1 gliding motility protein SprC [Flavobacterium azizsancarii]